MAKLVLLIILALPFSNVDAKGVIHQPECVALNTTLQTYVQTDTTSQREQAEKALEILRQTYPDWNDSFVDGEWDCSEMAAYTRFYLDSCGIPTTLVAKKTDYAVEGHVWLELSDGTIIEPTTISIADSGQLKFISKYKYYPIIDKPGDYSFQNTLYPQECDWWNSSYIKEQYAKIAGL